MTKKKKIINKVRVTILMKLAMGKRNIKDIMINLKLGIMQICIWNMIIQKSRLIFQNAIQ